LRPISTAFLGGNQAGCVGLLTLFTAGYKPLGVVAYDDSVGQLGRSLGLPVYGSIKESGFQKTLSDCDILVSVHGREIVPNQILDSLQLGGINAHPCLYRYKGSNPVSRMLGEGNTDASVGVHCMTDKVDEGEVLSEEFVNVAGETTTEAVYNVLYPYYAIALIKALAVMRDRFEESK